MKFSEVYNTDKTAAEEGVWTDIGYGVKVKIRSFDSAHTKALRSKLQAPFAHLTKMGKDIPEDDQNEINIKLIAGSSLIDWNFTDDEGNKLPYSAEKAEEMLRAESAFARDVIAALTSAETFKRRAREEDSGNS